jgi:hypothetical protein
MLQLDWRGTEGEANPRPDRKPKEHQNIPSQLTIIIEKD